MIAAKQLGRRCRIMELDPHYCDVILYRWETITGKKARLIDGPGTMEEKDQDSIEESGNI